MTANKSPNIKDTAKRFKDWLTNGEGPVDFSDVEALADHILREQAVVSECKQETPLITKTTKNDIKPWPSEKEVCREAYDYMGSDGEAAFKGAILWIKNWLKERTKCRT